MNDPISSTCPARRVGLRASIALIADNDLARTRVPTAIASTYENALAAIDVDPNHLLVIDGTDGKAVAMLQPSFPPSRSHRGTWFAVIGSMWDKGPLCAGRLGRKLIAWAVKGARRKGGTLVQLTLDTPRPQAHRFYQNAGFLASYLSYEFSRNT